MIDYAIFVQARLGSSRFPKKVLQTFQGKRVLDHVLESCRETGIKTFLLVPSSDEETFKSNFDVEVHVGSENDVLSRYTSCAQKHEVKNIVRITSDCPCLPASHIDAVVKEHRKLGGFVTNVSYEPGSYRSLTSTPDGFDVEVFDMEILLKANKEADDPKDREHVTSWMRRNCETKILNLALAIEGKFSLDNFEDLEKLERLFPILRATKTIRV